MRTYLFDRHSNREKRQNEGMSERYFIYWSTCCVASCVKLKPGATGFFQVCHIDGRGPNTLAIFCYFPQLHRMWRDQDRNWHPFGKPMSSVRDHPTMQKHWLKILTEIISKLYNEENDTYFSYRAYNMGLWEVTG